ncbi:MAG: sensor histidine kinase [bacterium]
MKTSMNKDFYVFARRILQLANSGLSRLEYLREASKLLIELTGCDAIKVRLKDGILHYGWEFRLHPEETFRFGSLPDLHDDDGKANTGAKGNSVLERLCQDVLRGRFNAASPGFTKNGSFWTGDTEIPLSFYPQSNQPTQTRVIGGDYKSIALIPFAVSAEDMGLLHLKSRQRHFFTREQIEFYEGIVQAIGIAVSARRAQAALQERIKELACLYEITEVVARPDISQKEILQSIVELLPAAMQHPEIAVARIIWDGRSYANRVFHESASKLAADIMIAGERRGSIEVAYLENKSAFDAVVFLREEQSLVDAIARQVAIIMERRQAESERVNLLHQLQHADRLATIGQLAAGVAHELNEPLGNILGFAQLAKKSAGLPEQAAKDIDKVVAASLHAREVIKKLLIFARQMPPTKTQVNLNKIVEESLYFLESRCTRHGIQLFREFAPDLPDITADPTQLQQVLVNLVVNAIQAMPQGGRLTVTTRAGDGHVLLVVEDTGTGMTEEVRDKLFTPFFTTKDIGQGTGLGLPVVHGIVTSHGGSIYVESEIGHGARFTIKLPIREPQENEEGNYV